MVLSFFSKTMKGIASRVLSIDRTVIPTEQLKLLKSLFSKYYFDTETDSLSKLLRELKRKHLVDSIVVSRLDGAMIGSSEANGSKDALTCTALFNYVRSELPASKTILIKTSNWSMLFYYNNKIYIVKAESSLTNVELKALAREIEEFLKNQKKLN